MRRVVLIHGAATDSRVWESTVAALSEVAEVLAPDRPQSGDLDTEFACLAPLCAGAVVIGVSGGATLGLALAARGVPLAGALLHEPAAGSLAPGLLDHVAAGLVAGGVEGFGRALYGPAWEIGCTTASRETVAAEFAMFGAFEPAPLPAPGRVLLTVGEHSPCTRHRAVAALAAYLGTRTAVLPGVGHAAHLEGGLSDARWLENSGVWSPG
ncbi:alpha/beta fold hydrolase [Nocardia blacklockiae]|uniref:alpha/beta fold hydrolase n=1 Tax=Nocardia blacklockiae TaxID=480036 RepID=UPI0018934289|nr:alpha/beta hydrolase [Nocardia blacklockiae]MBF6172056.1 alpha/beta hydrolase [Nocardia blacklockiae]